jgi:hypothetical protein
MPHSKPSGFFMFFNEIMMGKDQMLKKKCSFTSETTVDQIQEKLLSSTRNFTEEISQDIVQKSEINIQCGGENTFLKDYQLQHKKHEYNIFTGKVKPGSGCLSYGCCFDVLQNSKVTLFAINEASISDISKLENTITSSIVAEMKVRGDCPNKAIQAVQETIIKQRLKNEELILQEIRKSKISISEVSQKIELIYDDPLLCVNQCNETPSAGKIKQISNMDIMTRNMIKSVIENIETNVIVSDVKSTMDIELREGANKVLMWSIYSAAIIIVVYFLTRYFIVPLFWSIILMICNWFPVLKPISTIIRLIQDKAACVLYGLTTYLFMYLWWRFWKFGYCVHKSNGIVQTLMCFWRPALWYVAYIPFPIPPITGACLLCNIWCPKFLKEPCKCIESDCSNIDKGAKCNTFPLPT